MIYLEGTAEQIKSIVQVPDLMIQEKILCLEGLNDPVLQNVEEVCTGLQSDLNLISNSITGITMPIVYNEYLPVDGKAGIKILRKVVGVADKMSKFLGRNVKVILTVHRSYDELYRSMDLKDLVRTLRDVASSHPNLDFLVRNTVYNFINPNTVKNLVNECALPNVNVCLDTQALVRSIDVHNRTMHRLVRSSIATSGCRLNTADVLDSYQEWAKLVTVNSDNLSVASSELKMLANASYKVDTLINITDDADMCAGVINNVELYQVVC